MNPLRPGEKINIQLELDVPANTNKIPITIELLGYGNQTKAKFTTTAKTGGGSQHKMLHSFSWKVPAKLNGAFVFKATSPKLGKPAWSAMFQIAQHPEKQKRIYIISPSDNSEAQIGHQVTIQWQANGFDPSATADIIFSHTENNTKTRLNKKPVLIADRAWNWNIRPGTVMPGKGYLYLQFAKTGPVASTSFYKPIIVVDPYHYAPSFSISSPGPGQTAHWLAGTSVNIEWRAHNFEDHVTFFLKQMGNSEGLLYWGKVGLAWVDQAGNATKTGKTRLTLPNDLAPGPYQLFAWCTKYGRQINSQNRELAGGRRLVEIINPGKDSLPVPGTTFKIHKAVYSAMEGKIIVAIGFNAPEPFRFSCKGGPGGTQTVSYQLSNYELFCPDHKHTIASGSISVSGNASIFPTGVLGPRQGSYVLKFAPKLYKKAKFVTVKKNKNIIYGSGTGNFPDTYQPYQYFYPKLELFVTTYLSDGKVVVSKKYVTYIQNLPGMSHKTEVLEVSNPFYNSFTGQTQW